jgi:hypothetical protein
MLQPNIQISNEKQEEKIRAYHDKNYSYMSMPKFFEHAVNELMKREKVK